MAFSLTKRKGLTQVLPAPPLTKGGCTHLSADSPFDKRGGMSNKGGYRHTPKPQVDEGLLVKVFSNNSSLLGNMGSYDKISKSQGCDPRGLVKLLPLIKALVELEPTCEIHTSPLRKAIFQVLLEDGSLNDSKFSGAVWTNMKTERVGVLLYHMRRLAGSDLKQAASKLTGADYLQLQQVVEMIRQKEKPVNNTAIVLPEAAAPPRKLKREVSDVSVNSNGMPNCFGTPQPKENSPLTKRGRSSNLLLTKEENSRQGYQAVSFLKRRPGQSLKETSQEQVSLKAELGLKKKGKKKKKNKKGLAAKPKKAAGFAKAGTLTKGAGKAKSLTKGLGGKRKQWTKLWVTQPKKPPYRIYICGTTSADGKGKSLIVETTKFAHPLYLDIMKEIKRRLEKDHLTKEEAIALRQHLYETW